MKNIKILASIALMSIVSIGLGQGDIDNRDKLQFGLKAGANYANVYDEKTEEFTADGKFGFVGGLFFTIPLGKYLGIQPEVLYSQKGFKGDGSLLGSNYEVTRTTSFLDVPLLIAVKPSPMLTILVGPQYSYLLKQKDEFSGPNFNSTQEQEFENDNIRDNIFGFLGGIDVNLNPLVIGARVGFDFQDNNGDGTSDTPRYKNTWLQGTLGFVF